MKNKLEVISRDHISWFNDNVWNMPALPLLPGPFPEDSLWEVYMSFPLRPGQVTSMCGQWNECLRDKCTSQECQGSVQFHVSLFLPFKTQMSQHVLPLKPSLQKERHRAETLPMWDFCKSLKFYPLLMQQNWASADWSNGLLLRCVYVFKRKSHTPVFVEDLRVKWVFVRPYYRQPPSPGSRSRRSLTLRGWGVLRRLWARKMAIKESGKPAKWQDRGYIHRPWVPISRAMVSSVFPEVWRASQW